jgi:N-acetylmuramoyl-L-alanine amidase
VSRGEERFELGLGQEKLPEAAGGRQLDVPGRMVDGVPHVPLSALEDLLGARCTLSVDGTKGWFEPLITSVRLEGDGRKPKLVIRSSAPLTFKTFRLRQPDRYVIDLAGGVLDTPSLRVTHPELGDIRLGQFKLGSAVTRVVIPAVPGLSIVAPAAAPSREIAFELGLQDVAAPAQDFPVQKVTEMRVEPMASGQRVILQFSGPVQYEWTRLLPPDNRFFLDVPQAILVGPKQDVRVGGEYLRSVRISQFEAEPRPVTRVVVDLEQAADTRLAPGETPNSLVLEIRHQTIEPSMAMLKGYGTTSFPAAGGVVCLDPGHGGSDPGAVNPNLGITEKEVNLDICLRLARILRSRGWNVVMTRDDDRDVSWAGSSAREELGARVRIANDLGADALISVHCNASVSASVNGTSLHAYKRSDHVLAQELHPSLAVASGRRDRGVQKDRFYVLAHSKMPAVLIETAFISNPEEGRLLGSPEYRQRLAEALADGLGRYASRSLRQTTAGP